jgi:hypothetical protein
MPQAPAQGGYAPPAGQGGYAPPAVQGGYAPQPPGGYGQPPVQGAYDPAMMPRQVDAPNLEGWNPGDLNARGPLAWAAIVLCGCMALVRLAQGGLALAAMTSSGSAGTLAGGGVFSLVAAGFYVWAAHGLYTRKASAYRGVIRVNILLAALGAVGIVLLVLGGGGLAMGIGVVIQLLGVVFHAVALAVTYAARDNVGGRSEWGG